MITLKNCEQIITGIKKVWYPVAITLLITGVILKFLLSEKILLLALQPAILVQLNDLSSKT